MVIINKCCLFIYYNKFWVYKICIIIWHDIYSSNISIDIIIQVYKFVIILTITNHFLCYLIGLTWIPVVLHNICEESCFQKKFKKKTTLFKVLFTVNFQMMSFCIHWKCKFYTNLKKVPCGTQVMLYTGHVVHRSCCTQVMLCTGHVVHRSWCTGYDAHVMLYTSHVVHRSCGTQVVMHRSLYTSHVVHRSFCTQVKLDTTFFIISVYFDIFLTHSLSVPCTIDLCFFPYPTLLNTEFKNLMYILFKSLKPWILYSLNNFNFCASGWNVVKRKEGNVSTF